MKIAHGGDLPVISSEPDDPELLSDIALAEKFRRYQLSARQLDKGILVEVSSSFLTPALNTIKAARSTWKTKGGISFERWARRPLEWLWKDMERAILQERGQVSKGHDRRNPIRRTISLEQAASEEEDAAELGIPFIPVVPSALQGPVPAKLKNVRWHNSPPYTRAMRARVRQEIGPVVHNGFFGVTPHQDLTPREAEAVGYYVFGTRYEQARGSWDHEDYDDVLWCAVGFNPQLDGKITRPTAREIGQMMKRDEKGRVLLPNYVRDFLSAGAKKVGTNTEGLWSKVYDGIRHTRIRARIEAQSWAAAEADTPL